jgi:phage N-6-adenine-methyltransferase
MGAGWGVGERNPHGLPRVRAQEVAAEAAEAVRLGRHHGALGMNREEAEEYTQALQQVFTGGYRFILWADRQGIPKALGLSLPEWVQRIGGYARLSKEERREAVAELTEGEGLSNRKAAEVLGIGEATIRRDRQGAPNGASEGVQDVELETLPAPNDAPVPHVARATGENEWYTPKEYIDAARRVLGQIDLDPASTAEANEVVRAATFYAIEDNGLAQHWAGRVWMNPPYAKELIEAFMQKMAHHYLAGEVTAAIVLVNNATETDWFQAVARHASAICFPNGRVRFWGPDGVKGAPLQGQAVLYLGDDAPNFASAYGAFGLVLHAR